MTKEKLEWLKWNIENNNEKIDEKCGGGGDVGRDKIIINKKKKKKIIPTALFLNFPLTFLLYRLGFKFEIQI
jgi:hypothetical protein